MKIANFLAMFDKHNETGYLKSNLCVYVHFNFEIVEDNSVT